MKKIILGLVLASVVSVNVMAIDSFKLDPNNCQNLFDQAEFNAQKLFKSNGGNDAQYQAGALSMMMYSACISKHENTILKGKLDNITQELIRIKKEVKNLTLGSPTPSSSFNADMGDYQ